MHEAETPLVVAVKPSQPTVGTLPPTPNTFCAALDAIAVQASEGDERTVSTGFSLTGVARRLLKHDSRGQDEWQNTAL